MTLLLDFTIHWFRQERHTGLKLLARSMQESMKKSGRKGLLCFLTPQDELSAALAPVWQDAQLKNVLRLSGSLTHKLFPLFAPSVNCILCSPDEQVIDVFSTKYVSGSQQSGARLICMLNPKENLAVHILDKAPLYEHVARDEKGAAHLNILIAGSTPLPDDPHRQPGDAEPDRSPLWARAAAPGVLPGAGLHGRSFPAPE